jgi:hypothetical protein
MEGASCARAFVMMERDEGYDLFYERFIWVKLWLKFDGAE